MDTETHEHRIVNHAKSEIPKLCGCNKTYRKSRHSSNFVPKNWRYYGIVIVLLLILTIMPTFGDDDTDKDKEKETEFREIDWREGYEGHGTTHEQMGQPHWAGVIYTPFESKLKYATERYYPSFGMETIFNITHYIYDKILYGQTAISSGYIAVREKDTLVLGPKVTSHNWQSLIGEHWMTIVIPFVLLFIIILMPFVGVCYCCFCCCRKCGAGCQPCDQSRDFRRCVLFGFLLLLLIILLLLFNFVAFMCNRLLDRGLTEAKESVRKDSEDTCKFLKDAKEHIHHLFTNNYEEMSNHLTDLLANDARKHIFNDIGDASEANALEEMERILDSMPAALVLFQEVYQHEIEYRYIGDQLRDALRGVKRELFRILDYSNIDPKIMAFLMDTKFTYIDTSTCLHLDELPDTSYYIDSVKEIIHNKTWKIPKLAIDRFQHVDDAIAKSSKKVFPEMVNDIHRGRDIMLKNANRIQEIIEAIISDIYLNSLRTTKSLEDFYEKYNIHRSAVNMSVCIFIFIILGVLIIALIFGCFIHKNLGAVLLFLAMIFIFIAISFITLVGMFYFILGIVTYHGGCAKTNELMVYQTVYNNNPLIDLTRYISHFHLDVDQDKPQIAMASAMANCEAHQTIFGLLADNNIFNIEEMKKIQILFTDDDNMNLGETIDLSKNLLLTDEDVHNLDLLTKANLSSYHGVHYIENFCLPFVPIDLTALSNQLIDVMNSMNDTELNKMAKMNVKAASNFLTVINGEMLVPLEGLQKSLKTKIAKIDKLITYNNLEFGPTAARLVNSILAAEVFFQRRGKEFINLLITNLTQFMHGEVNTYLEMIVSECNTKVGMCEPLSHIYFRSLEHICTRLVDPMNGYWFGLIPCAFLLLPTLFVAHRLMCLFKRLAGYRQNRDTILEPGPTCSYCTRLSYDDSSPGISSGFPQKQMYTSNHRSGGGENPNDVIISQDLPQTDAFNEVEKEEDPSDIKRKKD